VAFSLTFAAVFGKKKKPMPDMPENATGATASWPASANAAESEEMLRANEAAAEHSTADPDNALVQELEKVKQENIGLNDKHLRLLAEFDNFRKRNAKERVELLQFASENALKNMLPVLDDMERAIRNNEQVDDLATVKQGFSLIHQKLLHIFGAQGVKPMADLLGQPLDVDRHEAITKAAAPTPDLKGKVIDVLENGYTLNDKVIRYAKVVVGE
jgi:molecular chaperone GrpE